MDYLPGTKNEASDVSFQLSFAATFDIMLYADPLTRWFAGPAAGYLTKPSPAARKSATGDSSGLSVGQYNPEGRLHQLIVAANLNAA